MTVATRLRHLRRAARLLDQARDELLDGATCPLEPANPVGDPDTAAGRVQTARYQLSNCLINVRTAARLTTEQLARDEHQVPA